MKEFITESLNYSTLIDNVESEREKMFVFCNLNNININNIQYSVDKIVDKEKNNEINELKLRF